MKRRRFVRSVMAAGLLASPVLRLQASSQSLSRTPGDFEGPFYPKGPRNKTNDLVMGEPRQPPLQLLGKVVNVHGEPLPHALVDIWQTDPLGRYKHPYDRRAGDRWSDFLYWGEARTDAAGDFRFRTYTPGAYSPRPAHIHYKIWQNRRLLLTSQIYFAELGGTAGRSRSPRHSDLQTAHIIEADDHSLTANFRVVI